MSFKKELETLINKHSVENCSNTPDWILANYIQSCLDNFANAVTERDKYYGVNRSSRSTIHTNDMTTYGVDDEC